MDDVDEIARTLRLLDEHRSRGEYVLHSARMVGDEEDHAIWDRSRRVWATEAVGALAECAVKVELQSLHAPAGHASASWKLRYEAELQRLNDDLDSIATAGERIRRAGRYSRIPARRPCTRVGACGRRRTISSSAVT